MFITKKKYEDALADEFNRGYGFYIPPPETSTYRVRVKQDEWYEHGNVAYVQQPSPASVSLHAPDGGLIAHYSYFTVIERVLDE